jgi:hypothetical protein
LNSDPIRPAQPTRPENRPENRENTLAVGLLVGVRKRRANDEPTNLSLYMIQKHLALLFVLAVTNVGLSAADKPAKLSPSPLSKSDMVVWAGLDFSLVRMYGTTDFRNPDNIFPTFPDSWNALFLQERIKTISSTLHKQIEVDAEQMAQRNRLAKKEQVIRDDTATVNDTHITPQDIAGAVKSYKLAKSSGLGLVFLVDRFVASEKKGAVHLVLFDIGSREVVATERTVARANGVGFRNYWFGVIKSAESDLKKFR